MEELPPPLPLPSTGPLLQPKMEFDFITNDNEIVMQGPMQKANGDEVAMQKTNAAATVMQEPMQNTMERPNDAEATTEEPMQNPMERPNDAEALIQEPMQNPMEGPNDTEALIQEPIQNPMQRPNDSVAVMQEPMQNPMQRSNDAIMVTQEPMQNPMQRSNDAIMVTQEPMQNPMQRSNDAMMVTQEPMQNPMQRSNDAIMVTQEPIQNPMQRPNDAIMLMQEPMQNPMQRPNDTIMVVQEPMQNPMQRPNDTIMVTQEPMHKPNDTDIMLQVAIQKPNSTGMMVQEPIHKPIPKLAVTRVMSDENLPMCRYLSRANCQREKCPLRHYDRQLIFCRDFQTKGCDYPYCKYAHATIFEQERYNRTGILPQTAFTHHRLYYGLWNKENLIARYAEAFPISTVASNMPCNSAGHLEYWAERYVENYPGGTSTSAFSPYKRSNNAENAAYAAGNIINCTGNTAQKRRFDGSPTHWNLTPPPPPPPPADESWKSIRAQYEKNMDVIPSMSSSRMTCPHKDASWMWSPLYVPLRVGDENHNGACCTVYEDRVRLVNSKLVTCCKKKEEHAQKMKRLSDEKDKLTELVYEFLKYVESHVSNSTPADYT